MRVKANRPAGEVSVIVPAHDEERTLARLLERLRSEPVREVIVADGGSRDDTAAVAERGGARLLRVGQACRGRQLDAGARAASGRVLLFVHADVLPAPGAAGDAARALEDPTVAGGGFRLAYDHDHPALRLLELGSGLGGWLACYGDQGFFCRAGDYRAAGGYPPIALFEDLALARALARRGRLVRLPGRTLSSARRFRRRGPWRQLALNAALVTGYLAGVPPRYLARRYAGGASGAGARAERIPVD